VAGGGQSLSGRRTNSLMSWRVTLGASSASPATRTRITWSSPRSGSRPAPGSAEVRKLFTTKAVPVTLAIAIVLAVGSVIIDAPGPGTPSPVVAGLVLAAYAVALLAAASRTTIRRDVT
jgi:hypothetical protein